MTTEYTPIGDKVYQEKVVQALFQDHMFAEQMADIIKPEFFTQSHLKEIVQTLFDYRNKYNTFPSSEIVLDITNKSGVLSDVVLTKIDEFIKKNADRPLNGDMGYIQDNSIDFCRRQSLLEGINVALEEIESNNFDGVFKIITDAAQKGASRDIGHDYMDGFDTRTEKSIRDPLPLPWPEVNGVMGGGPDRQSLITFVGPTGAGKTHFLVNCSAHLISKGFNGVYVSLEIADFKIGLRHDAYFSGIDINDVPSCIDRVREEVSQKVKPGRFFIKEYPTKGASVNTIRAYLRKLKAVKDFTPDFVVVDYGALLKCPRVGDGGHHDLETVFAELRGMAQELNVLVITADQTNRSALNSELVTIEAIGDQYSRLTVCDAIFTISRTIDDKARGSGRSLLAKSRFGPDGIVFHFTIDTAKVRVDMRDPQDDIQSVIKESEEGTRQRLAQRLGELRKDKK